ncbi:unnamed protein product [Trichobilharzia regenti]|nr:unnamed protein product [Trichobilharzia regenti]
MGLEIMISYLKETHFVLASYSITLIDVNNKDYKSNSDITTIDFHLYCIFFKNLPALQQGQQQSSGIIIPTSHQSLLPSFNGFTQYPQQNHTPSFQSSGASDLSSTTLYLQNNGTGGQGGVGSSGLGVGTDAASFNGTFGFTNSFRSNYQPTYSQSGQSSTTLGVSVVPPVGINYWPGNYSSQNYPIPQSQCYQNVTTAVINANSHNNNNNGSHSYQHQFQKQQYRIPEKYLSDKWISSQKLMNNNSIPSQSSYTTPLMISTQHHQHLQQQQQHQQCDYCRQLLDDQLSTVNNLSRYTLNNKHNYPMGKATSVVHTNSSIITNVRSNSDSCMNRTHNSNNNPPSEYDKKLQKYPIKSPVRRQVHGNELNNKGGSTSSNNTNKSFNSICPTKQPTNSVDSKRRYSQRHNNNNSNNGSNLNHTEANNDLNSNESVGNHNNSTKTGGRPHQAQSDSVVVSKISNKENNNNNNSSGSPDESYRHAAANVNPSCSPLTEGTVSVTTAATSTTTTVIPDHPNVDQIVTVDENNNKHESASSSSISSSCKNSQQSNNNNNNTKPSDTSVKSVALVIDETEWPKLETAVNTQNTRKTTSFTVS